MKSSGTACKRTAYFCLFFFLGIESGCHYYYVSKSEHQDAKSTIKNLEDNLKENKTIFVYNEGKYYRLSNLSYNADTTTLTASCKADTSYHVYNPYFDSVRRYRMKRNEQNVLKEVFIVSDIVNINRGSIVTIPLPSILRIETIKKNPGRSAANAFLFISAAWFIGIAAFGEDLLIGGF